jgi:hypothetical protein
LGLDARDALPPNTETTKQNSFPQITDVQVTLPGNPEIGVIHHIANHHESSHGQEFDDLKNLAARNVGVLLRLGELNVKHCFLEGLGVKDTLVRCESTQKKLIEAFPDQEIPGTLNEQQTLLIAQCFNQALSYFFPNMRFHGTEPPSVTLAAADHPRTSEEIKQNLTFLLRERCAVENITRTLSQLDPDNRTVALVYGAAHSFGPEAIPQDRALSESPKVLKESFEPWSAYEWSRKIADAPSSEEQIRLLQPHRRYDSWMWPKLLSPEAQLMALPLLKASLDWAPGPDQFAELLITSMKPGSAETREKLVDAIRAHHKDHSGPFADLHLRPGAEDALDTSRGKYAALAIWDETHAYTQLACVRAASTIQAFAFRRIITATAQLEALPKLVLTESPKQALQRLLSSAVNDTVKEEIISRAQNGEAPFIRNSFLNLLSEIGRFILRPKNR